MIYTLNLYILFIAEIWFFIYSPVLEYLGLREILFYNSPFQGNRYLVSEEKRSDCKRVRESLIKIKELRVMRNAPDTTLEFYHFQTSLRASQILRSILEDCMIDMFANLCISEFFNHDQKWILQIVLKNLWMTSLCEIRTSFFFSSTRRVRHAYKPEFLQTYRFALRCKPVSTISVPAEKPDPEEERAHVNRVFSKTRSRN